jgi:hypothetical protein
LGGSLLTFASGCGTVSAASDPKVAWAATEPAPLDVVVRRADAAETTSAEVNRILTATPANNDSDWTSKLALDKGETRKSVKIFREHAAYKHEKARILASEIWAKELAGIHSAGGKYPNVLAAVGPDLGAAYGKIIAKQKELADLETQEAAEETAANDKSLADAVKAVHEKRAADLDARAVKAEHALKPLKSGLIDAAKTNASKASLDVKNQLGVVVVNLRQAVDDAKIANGAAVLGFPTAVKGVLPAIQKQVPIIVAAILEEKTGKRPDLAGFNPSVTLEANRVGVTLSGLSKEDLGKITIGDLTTETASRTQKWTAHAMALPASCSSTRDVLDFESDVLEALQSGFETGGYKAPAATMIADGK